MASREKILDVARTILAEDGFEAITVAVICERAEVSNGSFFHAFRSKDALAAELWLDCLTAYHDAMLAVLRRGPDAAEGVRALVKAHLRWVETNRHSALLIFQHAQAAWRNPSRDAQSIENTRFVAALNDWRQPLVAAADLREIPDELFAAILIGPAQILCRAWLDGRSSRHPSKHVGELSDAAVRGLVNSKQGDAAQKTRSSKK